MNMFFYKYLFYLKIKNVYVICELYFIFYVHIVIKISKQ